MAREEEEDEGKAEAPPKAGAGALDEANAVGGRSGDAWALLDADEATIGLPARGDGRGWKGTAVAVSLDRIGATGARRGATVSTFREEAEAG